MDKRWQKHYDPGVPHTINPNAFSSIVSLIEESFNTYADRPCFTNFGEMLTYRQVNVLSQAYAAFLQTECGLQKGDRVAIMAPNILQYPIALLGAYRGGFVNVNISPLYTSEQAHEALKTTGVKCVLVLSNFAHIIEKAIINTQVEHVIVTEIGDLFRPHKRIIFNFIIKYIKKMIPKWNMQNVILFRQAVSKKNDKKFTPVEITLDELASLQFTEGRTTGKPKCVMLTHRNIISNVIQNTVWIETYFTQRKSTGLMSIFPLFKLAALTMTCLPMMRLGLVNHLITNPRDTNSIIKQWKKTPISVFAGIRTVFCELLISKDFLGIGFSQLKHVFSGGMPITQKLADRWLSVTNNPIIEGYATTETSSMAIIIPASAKKYTGSIGLPISSTEAKICDEEGKEKAMGERGEIWIKGPQVSKGYWNDPVKTKTAFTEDGWFRTGDIGSMNEEGYFYLIDRKEDIIKIDKETVYPSEVESVIADQEGVNDVVVIQGYNESGKGYVKACVVRSNMDLTKETLFAHCQKNLTSYQCPSVIQFMDSLPKSPTGFVMRRELRKEADRFGETNGC